jgi:hypothetical protein
MSQSAKLEVINQKLEQLKAQKQAIEAKEKVRQRKMLNKQKILLGGYYINFFRSLDVERLEATQQKILTTLKRQNDIEALNALFDDIKKGG